MPRTHNKKGRSKHGPAFVQLHKFMLRTPAWRELSHAARSAYIEVAVIYNGTNNGEIAMAARTLADALACSRNTAARALIELEDAGFLEPTRIGSFARKNRKASEYRLTMFRCDISGHAPSRKFMQAGPPVPQSHGRDRTVPSESTKPGKLPRQSHGRDRQTLNDTAHSPMGGTHIESHHEGTGETVVPLPVKARG